MKRLFIVIFTVLYSGVLLGADVEQWDVVELSLQGPGDGNPFVDVNLSARFTCDDQTIECRGFYDGGGTYRIRFSPPKQGTWKYVTSSNRAVLADQSGEFRCIRPSAGNHGPVVVRNTYHFAYADGTPFKPIGTTCYAWVHQTDELKDKTIAVLKGSPFNKVRMCVFPTKYDESDPPALFPFDKGRDTRFDLTRFNVEHFRNIDKCIARLRDIGVEADLILFHLYDEGQMGFDQMDAESDDRYLRYVTARFGAYRNVWWSMANEFDLMEHKKAGDWDRFGEVVQSSDAHQRLRSIHFSQRMYDQSKPWITHLSVQNGIAVSDFGRAVIYRQLVHKPVVFDEVKYEGNISQRWGQLTGEEMTMRFWFGTIAGTYVGHGEALRDGPGPVWLSKGAVLKGSSPARIAFLKSILETAPPEGITPIDQFYETRMGGKGGEYYLIYFGANQPAEWTFALPRDGMTEGLTFKADVIDTWNMTITPVEQTFKVVKRGQYFFAPDPEQKIQLPGEAYMAIRLTRVAGS
jgi:hypothetical protein